MIDFIRVYSETDHLPDDESKWNDQQFDAHYKRGVLSCWTCEIDNLLITIYPSCKIFITNSLHKFYHGHNCCDYSLSQIRATIYRIESITGITSEDWTITRLEFGFNIEPAFRVTEVLERCVRNKTHYYDVIRRGARLIEKRVYFTERQLKFYDKHAESKANRSPVIAEAGTLRVELVYKKIRDVPFKRLSALLHEETYDLLMKDLQANLYNTLFDEIDLTHKMEKGVHEFYHAGLSKAYWDQETTWNRHTAKSKKRRWKELVDSLPNLGIKENISELCREKVIHLINS